MILIVDNYDSFTYNLYQYVGQFVGEVKVVRNDELSAQQIAGLQPAGIIISPGPGRPEDSRVSLDVIRTLGPKIPLLGVCLGHQAIGQVHGGIITGAGVIMHGKVSSISHDGKGVFTGLPQPFLATRYHSLVISPEQFPADLEITARTDDGTIMGVRHRRYPTMEGVQFHPESILTENGIKIIENFVLGAGVK